MINPSLNTRFVDLDGELFLYSRYLSPRSDALDQENVPFCGVSRN